MRPPMWSSRVSPPLYRVEGELRDLSPRLPGLLFVPISKGDMLTLEILIIGRRRSGKSTVARAIMAMIREQYERHYPGRDLVQCVEASDPAAFYDWAGRHLGGDLPGERWPEKKVWVLHINDPMDALFYSQRDQDRIQSIKQFWRFAHILEDRIGKTGVIIQIIGPQSITKIDNSFRSADVRLWKSTIDGEKRAFREYMTPYAYHALQEITRDVYTGKQHGRRGDMILTSYGEEGMVHIDPLPGDQEAEQYVAVEALGLAAAERETWELSVLKRWARRWADTVDMDQTQGKIKRSVRAEILLSSIPTDQRRILEERMGDLLVLLHRYRARMDHEARAVAVQSTVAVKDSADLLAKKWSILSELEDRDDGDGFDWGAAVWAYRRNRATDNRVSLRDLVEDYDPTSSPRTLYGHLERVSGALYSRLGPAWEGLVARRYREREGVVRVDEVGARRQREDRTRHLGDLVVYYRDPGPIEVVACKLSDTTRRPYYTLARSSRARSGGSYAAEVEHAQRLAREHEDREVQVILEVCDLHRNMTYPRYIVELDRVPKEIRL